MGDRYGLGVLDGLMRYLIKQIFGPTIQGEGGMTGVVCDFIRMAGCNRWDGHPETKEASECPFCDTDFLGGDKLNPQQIIEKLTPGVTWVTLTGGEPMIQIDRDPLLVDALHRAGKKIALETNGSFLVPGIFDYVTISPKQDPGETIAQNADALKVLWPHPNPQITPDAFPGIRAMESYVQPIEPVGLKEPLYGAAWRANVASAVKFCLANPQWKLSAQVHKWIGVE